MSSRGRILVVDDEANARAALADLLRDEGYTVETAADGFKALPKLDEFAPHLVLTDLRMPGMDGLELLRKIQEREAQAAVIVMTAYGAVETAVTAMKQGAADYLTKPVNVEELVLVLERVLERQRLKEETRALKERLGERYQIGSMVGASAPMQEVQGTVLQVAPSRATVLITGESGTGKELIAAALHEHSPRAGKPFIKLHCAALAETLLESELFGHERGAFTGAVTRRDGRFQQADGGTLFLDEIGEISPSIQVKLLRFLQQHEFERVGGNQTVKVDVRVVAATNRNLLERVKQGHFREDLYYRLNVVNIHMPPLRSRPSDIALLATHFLARFSAENGKTIHGFSDEALQKLAAYPWPGNVREVENAIERAVILCRRETIGADNLAIHVEAKATVQPSHGMPAIPGSTLAQIERYAILTTLEHCGGATSKAAELLGISPRKIQYKLHEYSGTSPGQEGSTPAIAPDEE